jgi:hypothetical protein
LSLAFSVLNIQLMRAPEVLRWLISVMRRLRETTIEALLAIAR